MSYKSKEQVKLLRGTGRADREKVSAQSESNVEEKIRVPRTLSTVGKKKWRELVKELKEAGLLRKVDLGTLEMCCMAYDEVVQCQKAIDEAGGLIKYTEGKSSQEIPLVSVKKNAMATYKGYIAEFGLSPGSRRKIGVSEPKKESEFLTFLKNRGK